MTAPTDEQLLAGLPDDHTSIGISELAAHLNTTVRKLGPRVERLAELGKLLIDRPTGGYRSGERRLRRDGDSPETLRVKNAGLRTAAQAAVAILTTALGTSPLASLLRRARHELEEHDAEYQHRTDPTVLAEIDAVLTTLSAEPTP